jgi:hypothetical protein
MMLMAENNKQQAMQMMIALLDKIVLQPTGIIKCVECNSEDCEHVTQYQELQIQLRRK